MERAVRARLVITVLLISILGTLVTAENDAGSGGDAGDTSTTATSLSAVNGTYYGNLTVGDEDWYSFQMPNGTALSATLSGYNSSNDFDLYLYDSSGSSIDYSWWDDPNEEVSSNGTSIGGTTITLLVDAYSGSGNYTLGIWIFPEPQGPPQNDAGTGGDAGDSSTTATYLASNNQTISGWISDNFDNQDWYNISVPANTGIYVSMDFPNGTSSNTQLALIESTATYYINNDYYAPYEVTSNGSSYFQAGSSVLIRVITPSPIASSGDEGAYNLTISLFSTANQPGSNQDDAGSGGDAGNTIGNSLVINMSGNSTTFSGWVDYTYDSDDYYSVFVPSNWTSWATLQWNNSSADMLDLFLYDSSNSMLDYSYYDNPESVSGNSSSIGGSTVHYRVEAWTSTSLNVSYTMSIYIANLSSLPGFNQNDANSGGDAGDDFTSALSLLGNGSYEGWISDSSDGNDIYSVQVPYGMGVEAELWWPISSNDFDLGLYDDSQTLIDSSTSGGNPENVQSGATNVSNSTVYVLVQSYSGWSSSGGEGNYSLNITFVNMSDVPGLNQDDAYSGGDAGNDISDSTPIVNISTGVSIWPGYVGGSSDDSDFYELYVPYEHGIAVELSPGYSSDQWFVLSLYDSSGNEIDYDWSSNPQQSVSSNASNSMVGDSNVHIEVYSYSGDGLYNLTVWIFPLDADGDGFYDDAEIECGTDPSDNMSYPTDLDSDGICDYLDEDIDGDGVDNANDSFDDDPNETTDSDGDGTGDNADPDDDNDGWTDSDEYSCNTDPNNSTSLPSDFDGDGACDALDEDIDNDGYLNSDDQFDYDPSEWNDTDGDGIGDNSDTDDDNDGYTDEIETQCLSDPLSPSSTPEDTDTDGDGICDQLDDDIDGDGTSNEFDAFPGSAGESTDTDGDGVGDNADTDDDNDGVYDVEDAFPLDSSEWSDNDFDLLGDNSDPDDDNDGWTDEDESDCGTNPYQAQNFPADSDNDRTCDNVDPDDDNDGWNDTGDSFPFDPNEWDDLDNDNVGSNQDTDDDGDDWSDSVELSICGTDPRNFTSVPDDFDGDKICDNLDDDDDDDLVLDSDDDFRLDAKEWKDTDGDGVGDNSDSDDDDDGWADVTEVMCDTAPLVSSEFPDDNDGDGTCDKIDPDDDDDGYPDLEDAFPLDPNEWDDRNSDGLGDNANPLTTMDHMRLNPEITLIGMGAILSLISGSVAFVFSRTRKSEEFDENQGWGDSEEEDYFEDW